MERISSFKDFQSIYTERSQARLSEENEIKRDAIAERVKNILSEMEISSLTDLDEDTKLKFMETLFSEEVVIDAEEEAEVEETEESEEEVEETEETEESEEEVAEAEINSDEEFQEYAMKVLKQAHGDDFDEEKAQKAIDGLKSKYSGDYGAMIGALS
jgi:hypothetical protein